MNVERMLSNYQNVQPPDDPPANQESGFWPNATLWPCAPANWAALGAMPGGGGGMVGGLMWLNLAPASKAF